jgi:hypothetical protein
VAPGCKFASDKLCSPIHLGVHVAEVHSWSSVVALPSRALSTVVLDLGAHSVLAVRRVAEAYRLALAPSFMTPNLVANNVLSLLSTVFVK